MISLFPTAWTLCLRCVIVSLANSLPLPINCVANNLLESEVGLSPDWLENPRNSNAPGKMNIKEGGLTSAEPVKKKIFF